MTETNTEMLREYAQKQIKILELKQFSNPKQSKPESARAQRWTEEMLDKWLTVRSLPLQRNRALFPASAQGGSRLPVTPVPGSDTSFWHLRCHNSQRGTQIHTSKKESFQQNEEDRDGIAELIEQQSY